MISRKRFLVIALLLILLWPICLNGSEIKASDYAEAQATAYEKSIKLQTEEDKYFFGIHEQLLWTAFGYSIKAEEPQLALGFFTIITLKGLFK